MAETQFARQFRRSGTSGLIRQFGEEVGYYARDGSDVRTIQALVLRDGPELTVRVKNSDCDGISSEEIDTGGDEISVSLRVGDAAVRRSIIRLIDDATGMTRFTCE